MTDQNQPKYRAHVLMGLAHGNPVIIPSFFGHTDRPTMLVRATPALFPAVDDPLAAIAGHLLDHMDAILAGRYSPLPTPPRDVYDDEPVVVMEFVVMRPEMVMLQLGSIYDGRKLVNYKFYSGCHIPQQARISLACEVGICADDVDTFRLEAVKIITELFARIRATDPAGTPPAAAPG